MVYKYLCPVLISTPRRELSEQTKPRSPLVKSAWELLYRVLMYLTPKARTEQLYFSVAADFMSHPEETLANLVYFEEIRRF